MRHRPYYTPMAEGVVGILRSFYLWYAMTRIYTEKGHLKTPYKDARK